MQSVYICVYRFICDLFIYVFIGLYVICLYIC